MFKLKFFRPPLFRFAYIRKNPPAPHSAVAAIVRGHSLRNTRYKKNVPARAENAHCGNSEWPITTASLSAAGHFWLLAGSHHVQILYRDCVQERLPLRLRFASWLWVLYNVVEYSLLAFCNRSDLQLLCLSPYGSVCSHNCSIDTLVLRYKLWLFIKL